MSFGPNRRSVLKGIGLAAAASLFPRPGFGQAAPRVIVIGGGFAGATCARAVKRLLPNASVTLVEANRTFTACPFSNGVVAGLRDISEQQFGYDGVKKDGVEVVIQPGTALDANGREITLGDGAKLAYDRPPRLHRSGGRGDAPCVESGRADHAPAPPARGHGGRRHGRDVGAGEPLPLPARAL